VNKCYILKTFLWAVKQQGGLVKFFFNFRFHGDNTGQQISKPFLYLWWICY